MLWLLYSCDGVGQVDVDVCLCTPAVRESVRVAVFAC